MFTASTKKYDPDDEQDKTFDTWAEAAEWLLDQQRYGFNSMRINGERVRNHGGIIVNDEAEPEPVGESAMFQLMDDMVRATTDFNRIFRPQPTRGTAPSNIGTPNPRSITYTDQEDGDAA